MTATSQGATNRRKGHETERMVVRWLRQVGWPDACTTRAKLGHDGWSAPGDVSWHPLIVLEVKDVQSGSRWPTWCRQAVAASAPGQVPCVVRRTRGVADVSQWRVRGRCYEWVFVLGQVPAFGEPSHDVEDANGEEWPWVEVSMDELANAVAAVDRSGDA